MQLSWRDAALELVSTGGVILGISPSSEQRQGYFAKDTDHMLQDIERLPWRLLVEHCSLFRLRTFRVGALSQAESDDVV